MRYCSLNQVTTAQDSVPFRVSRAEYKIIIIIITCQTEHG